MGKWEIFKIGSVYMHSRSFGNIECRLSGRKKDIVNEIAIYYLDINHMLHFWDMWNVRDEMKALSAKRYATKWVKELKKGIEI